MKNFRIFLFLLISGGTLCAQNLEKLKKQALNEAETVSLASKIKDYDAILKYTHPLILEKYGKKDLRAGIEEIYRTMDAQNIKILSSDIVGITDIVKEQGEYRCLVNNRIKMDFSGRILTLKSSLFGFYHTDIKQWYFVESNKLIGDPATQEIFEDFETNITIPADEQVSEG